MYKKRQAHGDSKLIYANAMLDAKVVDFLTAKIIEILNNQFILVLYYYLDIYTV